MSFRLPRLLLAAILAASAAQAADSKPLYENNFESAELDKVPADLLVIGGAFAVKQDKEGKFLELPGEPLDTFGLLFGPSAPADVSASARFFGTKKGRKFPTFGLSLNGVGGYRLQVSPAKQALEFFKGDEPKNSIPFAWASDTWTSLRIQVRKVGAGWIIEGKAWPTGSPEPAKWMITAEEKIAARRTGWNLGSPYSNTPIRFDDLEVTAAK